VAAGFLLYVFPKMCKRFSEVALTDALAWFAAPIHGSGRVAALVGREEG
jgi:hypothetical protein